MTSTPHDVATALVVSHMAYEKEWPELAKRGRELNADKPPMRVFDVADHLDKWLGEALPTLNREAEPDELQRQITACEKYLTQHRSPDRTKIGRNLPFQMFGIRVASRSPVIIIYANEEMGTFYAFLAKWAPSTLLVTPTMLGWDLQGVGHAKDSTPQLVAAEDERVQQFAVLLAFGLNLVEQACADTKHIVSYRLNRAERRAAIHEFDAEMLSTTIVHHVCLNGTERAYVERRRGATVVPTPKRLHEVRAHWRRLRSGAVTRVRSHRRGQRGTLLPRVYSVPVPSTTNPLAP